MKEAAITDDVQLLKTDLYAEVIIPLALPKTFTWKIPYHLQQKAAIGKRVEVVLRSKKYAGILSAFVAAPEGFQPKEIHHIIDDDPVVFKQQIAFWKWIAAYYMCSEGEVMQAAIPSYLKLSGESVLIYNDEHDGDFSHLTDNEYLIAEALFIKKQLSLKEVQQIVFELNSVYRIVKTLVEKKVCTVWESLQQKYKPRTESFVVLQPHYQQEAALEALLNNWTKAPKQLELLLAYIHLLRTEGEVTQAALLKKSGASAAQLKALTEKNILTIQKRSTSRLPARPALVNIDFSLSDAQEKALEAIDEGFQLHNVCLLYGITGSGKTQIYIRLIERMLKSGKQTLYMLPEIALTAQIIRRLQRHFGGHIAVYHSKFNASERVEIWNRVKSGDIKIVLGARSSLFLPFTDLGLVIVDEEHDNSYKQQEPAPRYHARDAAIYLASLANAKVLLGSGTPSVESFFNARQNKFALVELSERYGSLQLPPIELIDLKKYPAGKNGILSQPMFEGIKQTLNDKKQVIVFQNRRGYSPYITCNVCGHIPQCKNCSVTLTYHKSANRLSCHYCGAHYPVIETCVACGSRQFIQKKSGTEKVEEVMAVAFPAAKMARMDYDSVKGKHDHDKLIQLFEQHKIDVLIGTQMVVKGLDFEGVDMVGIVDADSMLYFADFRVNERAFQLMEQVSGRAGRKNENGKVMVQLVQMTHPVLQYLKTHDYKGFYAYEIDKRNQFFYPPFSRVIDITLKHREERIAHEAAQILTIGLKKNFGQYLSEPAAPHINRIRNQYIVQVRIKLPRKAALIQQCKREILQQIAILQNHKSYRSVHIFPDVDP